MRSKIAQRVDKQTGILLSGGIDSAVLAALLPKGLKAYTIRFVAQGAVDEAPRAKVYADYCGLDHHVVEVHWQDHLDAMDALMVRKKAPLHAIEVALYKAASRAAADGVKTLIVGNGADSTFGGMDKLLSKDWTFDEFVARYTFIEPSKALREPVAIRDIYEPYRQNDAINVQGFLKRVHGLGIIQTFENAIHAGGCKVIAPYEGMALDGPLDIARIRAGEPKYLLQAVFADLFRDLESVEKIPFARPMTQWLSEWRGPSRGEFLPGLDMNTFTGDQKWLLYCLERFLGLLDEDAWSANR
ncbi:MAG: asparagine synthase [Candidatus Hydrogenedentes bacterium]|nr:asparagine synthase [Candidatus Hydrogenedentota bacterium]